jgi:preprotein translocase subunit SecE
MGLLMRELTKEHCVAEKTMQSKQPEKLKIAQKPKTSDREKEKPKEPNRLQRWYRETIGELRKVSWPTPQEAWRLTRIVLVVMGLMSLLLGVLDFVFSRLITLLVQ